MHDTLVFGPRRNVQGDVWLCGGACLGQLDDLFGHGHEPILNVDRPYTPPIVVFAKFFAQVERCTLLVFHFADERVDFAVGRKTRTAKLTLTVKAARDEPAFLTGEVVANIDLERFGDLRFTVTPFDHELVVVVDIRGRAQLVTDTLPHILPRFAEFAAGLHKVGPNLLRCAQGRECDGLDV